MRSGWRVAVIAAMVLSTGCLVDASLGPLLEVEEEDGDQVLVWLR
jgi:hypothetical protein